MVLFVIFVFLLVGIFFFLGFWGKFILVKVGLEFGVYVIVVVFFFVGLLIFFFMSKIWVFVFWFVGFGIKSNLL